MSNGERKEDKKTRISFVFVLFAVLAAIGYLNHGRMRYAHYSEPDRSLWLFLVVLIGMGVVVCLYVWWANRRDSK